MRFLETGWGADAVVGFTSTRRPSELLASLRNLCRPTSENGGILGICWPKVLANLLDTQKEIGKQLTDIASVYLIEDPQDPQRWRMVGGTALPRLLDEIGLKFAPVQPANSETSE
jgi:hypothetical protein